MGMGTIALLCLIYGWGWGGFTGSMASNEDIGEPGEALTNSHFWYDVKIVVANASPLQINRQI